MPNVARVAQDLAFADLIITDPGLTVFVENRVAARIGSITVEGDVIVTTLSPTVFANGRPLATMGSLTAQGKTVISGALTVYSDLIPGVDPTTLAVVSQDEIYFNQGPEAARVYIQSLVKSGLMTQAQVDAGDKASAEFSKNPAEKTPTYNGPTVAADCKAVHGMTVFPDSTKLTPKGTTLGDMIRKVTYPQHNIIAQKGLSKDQIVCNLANLAQNIWEPLKAKYPDALITNSFREGAGQEQHGTGQAIDVQFHGLTSNKYLERAQWIKANLPFDQLLLECTTGGKNGGSIWIHISHYSGTGIHVHARPEGNWYATMIDNANFNSGLRDLSGIPGIRAIPAA